MTEEQLTVQTASATYPVVIAAGAFAALPTQLAQLGIRGTLWLVSDSAVFPLYGPQLIAQLNAAGYTVQTFTVPAGEASKSHEQLMRLYDWLIGGGVERRDAVLALGGGVVGDLAGYAAATVLRGIALVHLPTTLLAMVDAAIGGKTAINHPHGKNLIGAFHQPRLVLADFDTLQTLPPRELRAGWAEVIKHGVIRDAGLFELLVERGDWRLTPGQAVADAALIRRAAAVKVAVVGADEHEQGERMILNYGHTLGHALEAATGYAALLHGEAVAIGMHAAISIARRLGMCGDGDVKRQRRLLHAYGLATELPVGIAAPELLTLTLRDKKVHQKRVRWILPTTIGSVTVRDDVPASIVQEVLEALPVGASVARVEANVE